jgi:spore maturation protein CgeB
MNFDIVIIGLSITSSWGNGHATTYRSLVKGLAARGHRVLFLECDAPWYAGNRDDPSPRGAETRIYQGFDDLVERFEKDVEAARLVIVGSYVNEGARVGHWVNAVARGHTAFYDIDTPVTLAKLATGEHDFLTPALVRLYDMYLSFTGGPVLRYLETELGSPQARPLYCSVDPEDYAPRQEPARWDLGYLGTYSRDRQATLETLLVEPAKLWPEGRFAVMGPMYPEELRWPTNVDRHDHLAPQEHPGFYAAQRFTLNVTRAEMKKWGFSPSVRLFEAACCAVPVISDWWEGLDRFFLPGEEIRIAATADESLAYLRDTGDAARAAMGQAARRRVLAHHTPLHRALEIEKYMREADDNAAADTPRGDGRGGQVTVGMAAGVASEPDGTRTGATPGPTSAASPSAGSVLEPSRTSHRDRQAYS